jgi:hemerythrin-like domain-containing protein
VGLIGGPSAPDFSDPLGLIAACHLRIKKFCDMLERLPAWIDDNGVDRFAREGATQVIRYFTTAALHHHADEEQDLFPLLRGSAALAATIERLTDQHRALDDAWKVLHAHLVEVQQGTAPSALTAGITPFVGAYREHIGIEDTQILPAAGARLTPVQKETIGLAMARRRSASPRQADPGASG